MVAETVQPLFFWNVLMMPAGRISCTGYDPQHRHQSGRKDKWHHAVESTSARKSATICLPVHWPQPPGFIRYVEAHGTGSVAGDITALRGIANDFCGMVVDQIASTSVPSSQTLSILKARAGWLDYSRPSWFLKKNWFHLTQTLKLEKKKSRLVQWYEACYWRHPRPSTNRHYDSYEKR